jgi:hypothetical protein
MLLLLEAENAFVYFNNRILQLENIDPIKVISDCGGKINQFGSNGKSLHRGNSKKGNALFSDVISPMRDLIPRTIAALHSLKNELARSEEANKKAARVVSFSGSSKTTPLLARNAKSEQRAPTGLCLLCFGGRRLSISRRRVGKKAQTAGGARWPTGANVTESERFLRSARKSGPDYLLCCASVRAIQSRSVFALRRRHVTICARSAALFARRAAQIRCGKMRLQPKQLAFFAHPTVLVCQKRKITSTFGEGKSKILVSFVWFFTVYIIFDSSMLWIRAGLKLWSLMQLRRDSWKKRPDLILLKVLAICMKKSN